METGEVLSNRTCIFRCISKDNYLSVGKKNAENHGYTITEVWHIGTVADGWQNKLLNI